VGIHPSTSGNGSVRAGHDLQMTARPPLPAVVVANGGAEAARRERFRVVYDANYRRLLGYAIRRTETEQDAADVVAETLTTAWRRLEDVPPGDEARLWLYGVARRALANQRRGERRRKRLDERLAAVSVSAITRGPGPDGGDVGAVDAAFRALRAQDKEILALVAWEELDAAEVGAVLGCSPNAARIRLHRARRRFAAALAGGAAGESLRRGEQP
jgi:DNA-directed RNA polymerase specialized sigma24 family protein